MSPVSSDRFSSEERFLRENALLDRGLGRVCSHLFAFIFIKFIGVTLVNLIT